MSSNVWLISTDQLIKKIRTKDSEPILKTFSLPVGCYYGRPIKIDLKLYPFMDTKNQSVSLNATITIPANCSQRRLFIHSCESTYRLSTQITCEGRKIAESCSKEVMLKSCDGSEPHMTNIYLDDILPHQKLLYYKGITLNVMLQLLLLKPRIVVPRVKTVEENGFLLIDFV